MVLRKEPARLCSARSSPTPTFTGHGIVFAVQVWSKLAVMGVMRSNPLKELQVQIGAISFSRSVLVQV
jgi:hypothetical protein